MQKPEGLALLREPFPANQISKLPKETKAQREEREKDRSKGIRCDVCGGWHHRNAVHLDYVGHAALTDRLLDCDPLWNWEPAAFGPDGLPALDRSGGMWIRLTVCGHTRIGYGHADGKSGGDAIKEVIGDALRNAAMRFGAALDLWHKGDLHGDDDGEATKAPKGKPEARHDVNPDQTIIIATDYMAQADSLAELQHRWANLSPAVKSDPRVIAVKDAAKSRLSKPADDLGGDNLPY